MLRGSRQLAKDLLRGSRAYRQLVTIKLQRSWRLSDHLDMQDGLACR